jgi:hypothetical protein
VDDDRATAPCGAIATVVESSMSVVSCSLFIMVFMFATWWKVVRKEVGRRKDEAEMKGGVNYVDPFSAH